MVLYRAGHCEKRSTWNPLRHSHRIPGCQLSASPRVSRFKEFWRVKWRSSRNTVRKQGSLQRDAMVAYGPPSQKNRILKEALPLVNQPSDEPTRMLQGSMWLQCSCVRVLLSLLCCFFGGGPQNQSWPHRGQGQVRSRGRRKTVGRQVSAKKRVGCVVFEGIPPKF